MPVSLIRLRELYGSEANREFVFDQFSANSVRFGSVATSSRLGSAHLAGLRTWCSRCLATESRPMMTTLER